MQVDILMATYNGASFLRQQLLSLLAQTHTDWRLLVHDDGSGDDTVSIVRQFASADPRIVLCDDGVTRLGPGKNFLHLLRYSDAPFLCFCDQDDVWLENKLQVLHDLIAAKDNDRPHVIFSNGIIYRPDNSCPFIQKVYPHARYAARTFEQSFFRNGGIQGAGAVFNREMAHRIDRPYRHVGMHDQVLTLAGILYGTLDFTERPLFLYRHHDHNVTGHAPYSATELVMGSLQRRHAVVIRSYYEGIAAFYEQFATEMNERQRQLFELYLSYPSMSALKRFLSIVCHRFSLRGSVGQLAFKLLLRPYID